MATSAFATASSCFCCSFKSGSFKSARIFCFSTSISVDDCLASFGSNKKYERRLFTGYPTLFPGSVTFFIARIILAMLVNSPGNIGLIYPFLISFKSILSCSLAFNLSSNSSVILNFKRSLSFLISLPIKSPSLKIVSSPYNSIFSLNCSLCSGVR